MAFAAIAAIVQAAAGVITGVNKSASDQYLIKQQEYQNNLNYARGKEMTYYNAYANQSLVFALIAIAGFIFLMFILYSQRKK